MDGKRARQSASLYWILAILGLLGIVALIFTDRRIAGMYLVALTLLFVLDRRYRKYTRSSTKAPSLPTDTERP